MNQSTEASERPSNLTIDPADRKARAGIYFPLAMGISATAFWGFTYTYFIPFFAGTYPDVSPAVHIHGWSFFLWFLLLPLQTLLIAAGRRRLHMMLGSASIGLAIVMAFTGILVAAVRIEQGLSAAEPNDITAFWQGFGQLIMFNMVLFIGFYGAAIARRKQPEAHKRLIILASASVLPAAIFRIIIALSGANWLATPVWVMPAAFFLPAVFIVLGMIHDRRVMGSVHRVYLIGLSALVLVHGMGLAITGTPAGEMASRFMAIFARLFGGIY